jgi:hypothetical protein
VAEAGVRQAVGRKLFDFALSQAAPLGIHTLHLEVDLENSRTTQL